LIVPIPGYGFHGHVFTEILSFAMCNSGSVEGLSLQLIHCYTL